MTSSISASHPDSDSDSDSVSTVTSETTTVRTTRQRRNRSPAAAPDFPEADVGDGLPPQRSSLSNEHSNKEGAVGVVKTFENGDFRIPGLRLRVLKACQEREPLRHERLRDADAE